MSAITILIVEDEVIVAADLAGKLARLGYDVAGTAAQGEEAVALACRLRPQLVLMDIWLEGPMDGIAAAEAIRRRHNAPIVYLTAHSDPATLARAKLTGPFGYILKPFEERELATQIEMALFQHQADRQIRQQRELLRVTLNSIGDAVIATGADGRITFINPVAESLTGWKTEEVTGQPVQGVFRIVNERTGQALEEPVARVLRERRAVDLANHAALVIKDGRMVPVEDSAAPILDAVGNVIGVVLVFHDVTGKRRAEEALRASEQRYRSFVEASAQVVWTSNLRGEVEMDIPAWQAFTGLTAEQARGLGWMDAIRTEDRLRVAEAWRKAFESRGLYEVEYLLKRHDGAWRDILARGVPVFAADGGIREYVGTCIDITERKRAEEEAKAAKDSAEHANRAKDHFLAVLSHELRTPLTPVVMGVSMLQNDPNLDPKVRETLEMVRRHVEMEARLVDDLLDVSRIARGKIELSRSAVELCTVIQRAVEVCKPDIEARRLHFGVDLGPDAPYWVNVDAARLQQVFWNLLKNAVKFTPHDGCVGVRCRLDGTHVVIEVNDSGIGIEPESLPRIFNAFEQAELSITRQFGGLGLGLAISKALVELHGGEVTACSEGRDKGATFRVRLPLCAPAGRPKSPAPAAIPKQAVRPLHILLVEDHGVTAKMIRMVLTSDGHTVESAGDVATALELAGQHAFDLLVSDLGLPDGSGQDLMRELRLRGRKFPGIALSGYGQEEDIRRSYEAGFAAHLTKPASREAILEAIAAVTAGGG